jgi:protein AaeX
MITEWNVGGVFMAPIVLYTILAALIFAGCRLVLARIGFLHNVWHPALFELALFLSILSLLVRFF